MESKTLNFEELGNFRGKIDLSRRGFLTGSAIAAASVVGGAAFAGCASQDAGSASGASSSETPEAAASSAPAEAAPAAEGAAAAASASFYSGNAGKTMGEVLGAGWLGEEPEIDNVAQTITADIVVCGAGHAGVATARHAAELGADVVLVERLAEENFMVLGNDIGHLNSSWQMDRHGVPHYDEVDFMNEYQIYCAGRAQPTLISQFAWRSGEAFDWFIDSLSEEEKDGIVILNWPVVEGYDYKKGIFKSYVGTPNFGGSVSLKDALTRSLDKAKDAGCNVMWETEAVRLVHNDDGTEVTGVICSQGGDYIEIDAKAVVLACGDIGANSDMYNAICTENYWLGEFQDCSAMSGRNGSGIAMAMRIGAKVEIATGGDMGSHAAFPLSPMEACETIWLNKYGKRFSNEGYGGPLLSGCAAARQPGNVLYTIWDSDWKTVLLNQIAGHLALKDWREESVAQIEEYINAAVGSGPEGDDTSGKFLYCADTLEELVEWMGLDEGAQANALAAVETWNKAIEEGTDAEFGRATDTMYPIATGPFYGFASNKRVGGGSLVATSGLLVTGDQQVQGQGFEPIKGLYATGNTSGGRFPMGYNGIMNGVSIGMCLTLGYVLGEFLATGDLDAATTVGSGNAEPKQSDKGMGGPPPMGGDGEGGMPGGEGGEGGAEGGAPGEGAEGEGAPEGAGGPPQ